MRFTNYESLFGIVQTLPDAVCLIDPRWNVRFWNSGAEKMLGYKADEIIGKSIALVIPGEIAQKEIDHCIHELTAHGEMSGYETVRLSKDGRIIPVELTAVALKQGETITGYASIMRDITERKQAEKRLRESEEKYRSIVETTTEWIWEIDREGKITFSNTAITDMLGYGREGVIGRNSFEFMHPDDIGPVSEEVERAIREKRGWKKLLVRRIHRNGGQRYIESNSVPVVSDAGAVIGFRGLDHDLTELMKVQEALTKAYEELEGRVEERTRELAKLAGELRAEIEERKRIEEALRRSEKRLSSITSSVAEGIYVLDENGRILFMNPEAERLLGWTIDEVHEKSFHDLVHFRTRDGAPLPLEQCNMHRVIKTGKRFSSTDEVFVRKNGSVFPISVIAAPIIEEGRVIASIIAFNDITELKRHEEEIKVLAHHDALTGLPNRRLFRDLITVELAQARRNRKKMAVLFLDLDRFKDINDTLGHDTGDLLLKEVAARFKISIRQSDTIARIGGDEFNIIIPDITLAEAAAEVARKITDSLKRPVIIADHALNITASVGISVYPDDSGELDDLLSFADMAMYHAKESGRNQYRFYNPAINTRSRERMRFESRLRQALDRGELVLYFQPVVSVPTRQIAAAEALVRWAHPEMGLLEPRQFIPAAEEIGLITSIDEWVLHAACSQIKKWMDAGLKPVGITVNLSQREFQKPELAEKVSAALRKAALPSECLSLELTETAAMSNIDLTISRLKELRDIGIKISIDNFGTGYSSLNYLKRLPIRQLKIDRTFVRDITTNPDDRALISAVTSMAHTLEMKVIAEGVETEDQLSFLSSTNCDEAQGFLFSGPVSAEEFESRLMK